MTNRNLFNELIHQLCSQNIIIYVLLFVVPLGCWIKENMVDWTCSFLHHH